MGVVCGRDAQASGVKTRAPDVAALQTTSAKNVALVDAFDTFIANPPSQSLRVSLSRLGSSEVLVGGECMHYPVCNVGEMLGRIPAYRQCHESGYAACAPNGLSLIHI